MDMPRQIAEVDHSNEGIQAIRQALINHRDPYMFSDKPDLETAMMLSHAIVLLHYLIGLKDACLADSQMHPVVQKLTFPEELSNLLNYHSIENNSNTPDFILSHYLLSALQAFEDATRMREDWYGRHEVPGGNLESVVAPE